MRRALLWVPSKGQRRLRAAFDARRQARRAGWRRNKPTDEVIARKILGIAAPSFCALTDKGNPDNYLRWRWFGRGFFEARAVMLADGRAPVGRGPYPPQGRQGTRRRWDRRLAARTLQRGQVPASPARVRLPAAMHVAALDYQDAPDVGTRASLGSLADPISRPPRRCCEFACW